MADLDPGLKIEVSSVALFCLKSSLLKPAIPCICVLCTVLTRIATSMNEDSITCDFGSDQPLVYI